jgi:SAM-dependent methyltransferase
MTGSLSFDRAAEYYDATRVTDPATLGSIVRLLSEHVAGEGPVLEIGVGTGQLALPLAATGVRVTGLDLSSAMMAKLTEKSGGISPIPLVRGDATAMPFGDRVFAGAYARWVLHLISAWQTALRELDRVVAGDGAIGIEPGGESGVFRDVFLRFHEILGDVALPPWLHPVRRGEQLDAAMGEIGWRLDHVEALEYEARVPLATFFDEIPDRRFSWTWSVPDDALMAASGEVRAWAAERFDLDAPQPVVATRWRVYRRV